MQAQAAPSAPLTDSAAIAHAVDSLAQALVDRGAVAGVSVAVSRAGRSIVNRGYGFADVAANRATGAETVYGIGSVTKQVTAALVMREVERGRVRLDEPLTRYLPEAPVQGRRVLVRQLLNHTSGIPSYTGMGERWLRQLPRPFPRDSFYALVRSQPFDFEPGDQWRYDNSGYWLLGLVLERVERTTYAALVRDAVAAPLGLGSLAWCADTPPAARGYDRRDGTFTPAPPIDMSHPFAAGALCATAGDLVRWSDALADGRVVSAASYARMITPDTLNNGSPQRYGFGLMTGAVRGHPVVAHGGQINGFSAHLVRYPQDSLTVAVLANTGGDAADVLASSIGIALLGLRR